MTSLGAFDFATAGTVVFGTGSVGRLSELCRGFGSRVLLVTGKSPERVQAISESLVAADFSVIHFPVSKEPDLALVEAGRDYARASGCEWVLSVGGGSVIDAGKAIAAMLTNPGDLLDYLEVIGAAQPLVVQPAPFVAVPTTAGTGAEVTRNAVLQSPAHRRKVSLRSPRMLARVAIVDPALTLGLPQEITAASGMDALTQLIEAYVSRRANPLVDALCRDGIPRAARAIRTAFINGDDLAAREAMSYASLLSGLALANAGLGAVHGFAGAIGGLFDAAHGAVCAILLAPVMEMNIQRLVDERSLGALGRYREIAGLLTQNPEAPVDAGVAWVRSLVAELGVPSLATYGIVPTDFEEIAAAATQSSSMKGNPVALGEGDLQMTLERAF